MSFSRARSKIGWSTIRLRAEELEDRRLLSLTHEYTFNDGTANDSVGSANGTLMNGATVVEGWLTLQNGGTINVTASNSATAQYASLPSGILPSNGSASIEVWYTNSSVLQNWTRVFDFGDQLNGSGNSYLYLTPHGSGGDARAVLRPAGGSERVATYAAGTDDGFAHFAAVVIDATAGQLRLYVDGTLASSAALSNAGVNNINQASMFLGRSLFDTDSAFTGSIDDVRIYNNALSAADISLHAADGATRQVSALPAFQIENLDRGVVAFNRSSSQAYVGWRLLATDTPDVAFNVYRVTNGGAPSKRNSSPITASTNFTDTGVTQTSTNEYFVRTVINSVEGPDSRHFTIAANTAINQYLHIALTPPPSGVTPDGLAYTYNANDASAADLDGDGQMEIIIKWDTSLSKDSSQDGFTGSTYFDAYKLDGTQLWRINLGQNIRAGAHYTQFMVYDFDGDGKAEMIMKTAPGTIDGLGNPVLMGSDHVTDDYRNATTGRINSGPEYLTVFNGLTGANMTTVAFLPDRVNTSTWGDDYGNRQDRILMCVAYIDGARPSLIVGRGLFPGQNSSHAVRNEITAWNFRSGSLTLQWWFRADKNAGSYGIPDVNTSYVGQGNYEVQPADLNGDGKDELIYGQMVVNSNGTPRYSTGLGHGDTLHVSDFDPTHPGEEIYMAEETPSAYGIYGGSLRDGSTGAGLVAIDGHNADVGRGVAGDLDPRYLGAELWQSADPDLYSAKGVDIQAKPSNMFQNFVIQWDADPLSEMLDGTTISNWVITNGVGGRSNYVSAPSGLTGNNGTKNTPCLTADLFGDWREEVVWREVDGTGVTTGLQIWSTVISAANRMVTPLQDRQYREAVAWQNVGYNQPTHTSYFLGDGMNSLPTPTVYFAGGPSSITLSNSSVAENQPTGTTIGTLSSTASGTASTYTYSLVVGSGGDDNSLFTITGSTLKTNASFNYEAKSSYTVRIRTTDATGLFMDKVLSIAITDVNEAPTAIALQNTTTSIAENTSTVTHIKVADIVVTDDALGSNNLYITGSAADTAAFEIQGASLYIKAGTVLDFETKSSYTITVNVDDTTVGSTPDQTVGYTLTVTNVNEAPTVATAASASPSTVAALTTSLSVLGADDGGEPALTYTWATTGSPPAAVSFSANGANASKNTTATFAKAGSYAFQVTITDAGSLSTTSAVNVSVSQTPTTISVSPGGPDVVAGQTQQFTATVFDQFGNPISSPGTILWSATGAGSVNSNGLFTASTTLGGYSVTATLGSISNSASGNVVTPTYVVTNTNDSGVGSLRQAILDANAGPAVPAIISFAIPGSGTQGIQLASTLANLVRACTFSVGSGSSVGIGTASSFTLGEFPALTVSGGGSLTIGGNQMHTSLASLTVSAGTSLTLASDIGSLVTLGANGATTFSSTQHLAALSIGDGATVTVSAGGTRNLFVSGLSEYGTGSLNLTNHSLVFHATSGTVAGVESLLMGMLASGYGTSAAHWDGNGIHSSVANADSLHITALGLMRNGTGAGQRVATFAEEGVGPFDLLVKYTYFGDANLDGVLNAGDYALADTGFNFGRTTFGNGDFNYDGTINGADFALLDNAFQFQGGPLSDGPLTALSLTLPQNGTVADAALAAYVAGLQTASSPLGALSTTDGITGARKKSAG